MSELSFCLVTTFYPPHSFGGDAVHVHRLATGLARRGHRVRVVYARGAFRMLSGETPAAEGFEDDPDIEVVSAVDDSWKVAATYLVGGPVGYRSSLAKLVEGFEVVHFHNPSLVGAAGGLRLSDALKLYTTHEHWLLCPTHVLFRYQREVCTKRTCWRCTVHYGRPPQLWRSTPLLESSVASLDLLLAPSRFTADLHRAVFSNPPIEVLGLPGPTADQLANLPELPAETPSSFFLYAGRLEPIKGVDRLPAVAELIGDAQIVVVGSGSLGDVLSEASTRISNLHVLGPQPYGTVLALCRAARAVVIPSSGYETFGGVAVESMATGTPVVVRDIGPLPELVEEGGGWTFGTDEELAKVLTVLWSDESLSVTEGRIARKVYERRWTEERFFERYFELIAEAARRRGDVDLSRRVGG
jgi:glycosyltransferase involved in cell wall biosynthesis